MIKFIKKLINKRYEKLVGMSQKEFFDWAARTKRRKNKTLEMFRYTARRAQIYLAEPLDFEYVSRLMKTHGYWSGCRNAIYYDPELVGFDYDKKDLVKEYIKIKGVN